MKITRRVRSMTIGGTSLEIGRTAGGVVDIHGNDLHDLMRGLGFAHAHDRLSQMMLVRLVGQGRLCECLNDNEETLTVDVFTRQLGFVKLAREECSRMTPSARAFVLAYCEGVNEFLRGGSRPWGLRLTGYRPEPWEPADTLLTMLLMSYAGLAQTQQDFETFLIQSIRAGVDVTKLKRLFTPHLDEMTDEHVALIRRLRHVTPLLPGLPPEIAPLTSSNNWAVAPHRSATGAALQCNDPHLECNRLPAVWYEAVLHAPGDYQMGVTIPGVPGILMGRTRRVSYGFTYGFMDLVDYVIEECQEGRFRREEGFQPLRERRETIRRKQSAPAEITIRETDAGTLEVDPRGGGFDDGLYLARAFSATLGGTARTLDALSRLPQARNVVDAQIALRDVSISCNWVIADREGNIGYQQSGLLPDRSYSGLFPVIGWKRDERWRGLVDPVRLSTLLNPPDGVIVTANDDWNQPGRPRSIGLSQGPYRATRIAELLRQDRKLTTADMRRMQADLYSVQARRFMDVLRPLIPDTPTGRLLAAWDLRYDVASRGATLFEAFYRAVQNDLFGTLFGPAMWHALVNSTNLLAIYFQPFDEALLSGDAAWFGARGQARVFREALAVALDVEVENVAAWGDERQVVLRNLLLGGKLPGWLNRWLQADRGPIPLPGNRSTIVQSAIFKSHGRISTFAPSYRYVTDLGTDTIETMLAGGPSERVLSSLYACELEAWQTHRYKTLSGEPSPESTI
jgi:penicillin G amidase